MPEHTHICQNPLCGKPYTPTASHRASKYCSMACTGQARTLNSDEHREGVVEKVCAEIVRLTAELAPKIIINKPVSGPIILTADWHSPNIHLRMFETLLHAAKTTGIRKLAIIGDFMDMRGYSDHPRMRGSDSDILDAKLHAQTIMDALAKTFDTIYLAPGNHDYWLVRFFMGEHTYTEWMTDTFREFIKSGHLRVFEMPFVFVHDSGEKFVAIHQRTFSGVNPAGIAKDMESRWPELRNHHVICTHGHLEASMRSWAGHKQAISMGCMTDRLRTAYPLYYPTRHGAWNAGFGIITAGWWWPINEIMSEEAVERTCMAARVHPPTEVKRKRWRAKK